MEPEKPAQNFESALRALESCVNEMEQGRLTLDASLQTYQQGVQLAQVCQRMLEEAQQKVQVLEEQLLKPLEFKQNDE